MANPQVFLKVLRGEDKDKGWELEQGQVYTLGRSRSCNLHLADTTASASHARLECRDGVWLITDEQSTHGTRVNDRRILGGKPLFDRDRIRLGKTLLEFREYEQLDDADLAEIDRGVHLPD